MSQINIKNINKFYDSNHVIKDVSIDIKSGSFTVLVGPSGCGKSTVLRMIAGLETIDSGSISIAGKKVNDLPPKERNIAMVFQSYALYPHMTVFENMSFGLRLEKRNKSEIFEKVTEAAKILKIEEFLDRKPKQLSGGQRQRVAIGRAITRKPDIFLFDEPLSNLDAALRVEMRVELARLHEELEATMIYVTHDQTEAMTLADEIVILNEGVVSQIGKPMDLYNKPLNSFVGSFIGSPKMNFFKAKVISQGKDSVEIKLANALAINLNKTVSKFIDHKNIVLGVRPEHLRINKKSEFSWESEVHVVEKLGSESFIYAGNKTDPIVVQATGETTIKPGEKVKIGFNQNNCHIFNI